MSFPDFSTRLALTVMDFNSICWPDDWMLSLTLTELIYKVVYYIQLDLFGLD